MYLVKADFVPLFYFILWLFLFCCCCFWGVLKLSLIVSILNSFNAVSYLRLHKFGLSGIVCVCIHVADAS